MRAISYSKQTLPRFRREDLPACALFLLLYALGVSCGMASYGDVFRLQMLPPLSSMQTDVAWWTVFVRAVLCCASAAIAQSALILFCGLSAWLLPLWTGVILVRAVSVGVCVQLCVEILRTGAAHAELFVLILAVQFILMFPSEVRLGILPLARRTVPDAGDAEYLAIGLRAALYYVLLSSVLTISVLYVLYRVYAG